jgi:hypothetical protein
VHAAEIRVGPGYIPAFTAPLFNQRVQRPRRFVMDAFQLVREIAAIPIHVWLL